MINEVFFLSSRGDVLASRSYQEPLESGRHDAFFGAVMKNPTAPPVLAVGDTQFVHILHRGVYVVCATQENVSPSETFEFMRTLVKLIKDFCGVFGEDAIRRNFILVQEILDEVLDAGYIQTTDVGQLMTRIKSQAAQITEVGALSSSGSLVGHIGQNLQQIVGMKTVPSSAANRPVAGAAPARGRQ